MLSFSSAILCTETLRGVIALLLPLTVEACRLVALRVLEMGLGRISSFSDSFSSSAGSTTVSKPASVRLRFVVVDRCERPEVVSNSGESVEGATEALRVVRLGGILD